MLQPADLKSLAGEWEGSATGSRSGTFGGPTVNGRLSIKEDGTFTSNVEGKPGAGTMSVVDGKLAYQGTNMKGTATVHGAAGQEVIKGEGTLVGVDGLSRFELRRR
jgi:hypothetical protein